MSTENLFRRFNKLLFDPSNNVDNLWKRVKAKIVSSFNNLFSNPIFAFPPGTTSDKFINLYTNEGENNLSAAVRGAALLRLLESGKGYEFFSARLSPASPDNPALLMPDRIYTASKKWNKWMEWSKSSKGSEVFSEAQTQLIEVLGRVLEPNAVELKTLQPLEVEKVKAKRPLKPDSNLFGDWSLAVDTVGRYIVTEERWRDRLPEISDYLTVSPTLDDIDRACLILVALSSDNPLSKEFREQSLEMTTEDIYAATTNTLFPGFALYTQEEQKAVTKAIQTARNKVINIVTQVFLALRRNKQEPLVNISLERLKGWSKTPKDVCLVGGDTDEPLAIFGLGNTFFCYPRSQILESLAMGLNITPGGFRIPDDYVRLMRKKYSEVITTLNKDIRKGLYNPEWINKLSPGQRKTKQISYAQTQAISFGVPRDTLIHHNIDLLTIDNQDEMGERIVALLEEERGQGSKKRKAHETASLLCKSLIDTSDPLELISTAGAVLLGRPTMSVEKVRRQMATSISAFSHKYFATQKLIKKLSELNPSAQIDIETRNTLISVEAISKKDVDIPYTNSEAIQLANNTKTKIKEKIDKIFDREGEKAPTPLSKRVILPDLKDYIEASVATKVPELMEYLGYTQKDLDEWPKKPVKEKEPPRRRRPRGFGRFG